MYKVRMTSKQEGRKKTIRKVSEAFSFADGAREFINLSIKRQGKLCWQAWGLMVTDVKEEDGKIIAEYKPALTLIGKLVQTFEIVSA